MCIRDRANHDIRMLQVGSYPYYLKQRILGDRGHLSNENAGKLLCRLLHDDMKAVFLGHLSKESNFPELAYQTVVDELLANNCNTDSINLSVASRELPGRLIKL